MTPEAQNIALAEACGWGLCWCSGNCRLVVLPNRGVVDLVRDLNAQFEAWQKLTDEQKLSFRIWVGRIAMREGIKQKIGMWFEEAQARFGCECLLRALGKWIE